MVGYLVVGLIVCGVTGTAGCPGGQVFGWRIRLWCLVCWLLYVLFGGESLLFHRILLVFWLGCCCGGDAHDVLW